MTENNAAQPGLTDSAIQALWDEACKDGPQSPGWNRHIRFARALLSKLRAEGVQAGGLPAYINDDSQPLQYRLGWNNCLSDCRAALASAPVASEAVRDAVDVALPLLPKGHARNSDV
ncbi:MAG: hypothetical protein QHC88_12810, partial [Achromobacter sp.]|uniref:hypothetical protein n=1 Tax=Achromobacter sp. TaxID=134375 RepID=UPI0029B943B2